MPGYVNGIPHATSTDRIDLWPTTSRTIAQWVDENVPRNDDPRLTNARPPTTHTHDLGDVAGLQDALNGKTDTTDPRLSDARTPTAHTHELADVTGLAARLAALEYDSGRRVIHEELINGWTAADRQVSIQRRGDMVTLTINSGAGALDGTGATSDNFWLMPLGFRPAMGNYGHVGWVSTVGASSPVAIIKVLSALASPHRGLVQGLIMWPTSDPIPTTLPGDPA